MFVLHGIEAGLIAGAGVFAFIAVLGGGSLLLSRWCK